MAAPLLDSVQGHKAKYEVLRASRPANRVGADFVGGGDPILTGFTELEIVRRIANVRQADIIDLGCGIGRLARHLLDEDVRTYLGTDVVPEILQEAINVAEQHPNFRFSVVSSCTIPAEDASVDIVTAFSVFTHLIDEEIFEYLCEAKRVLRSMGTGIFSFMDFMNPVHRPKFFNHARQFRNGHGDLLRFSTRDVLTCLATGAGFSGGVDVIDGAETLPISGTPSSLLDISTIPPTFKPGQSVFVVRP